MSGEHLGQQPTAPLSAGRVCCTQGKAPKCLSLLLTWGNLFKAQQTGTTFCSPPGDGPVLPSQWFPKQGSLSHGAPQSFFTPRQVVGVLPYKYVHLLFTDLL